MSSISSWPLGPQLGTLFQDVTEPLGGSVLLEEICHGGWTLFLASSYFLVSSLPPVAMTALSQHAEDYPTETIKQRTLP